MKSKIILFILTIACFGAIFFFSCQPATESDAISGGIARKLLEMFTDYSSLAPQEQYTKLMVFDEVLRSLAHFGLALLSVFFLYTALTVFGRRRPAAWTVAVCFLYSLSDEIHQQLFAAGRAFQLEDIAKDWAGALVGLCLAAAVRVCRKTK